MFRLTTMILLFLYATNIYAFQDYDIDGVADNIDRCPNTSFDAIVDTFGCSIDKKNNYVGKLTLQLGAQLTQDDTYQSNSALNLYANYRYKNWDISLSNLRTTTGGSYVEDNFNSDSDIYLSAGYFFMLPTGNLKLSLGTRFLNDTSYETNTTSGRGRRNLVSTSTNTVSLNNDYFVAINYDYNINQKQNMFLYTGYTITSDSTINTYENYTSFSIGTGYTMNHAWYTSIAYNYTGSIYADSESEQSISLFNSYNFTQNLFATATYTYALDDLSYDHTLLLTLGIVF